jgi:hypothetical protein
VILLFYLSHHSWHTDACHHTQLFLVEMASWELFLLGHPPTTILQILASQVARIVGMSHWCSSKVSIIISCYLAIAIDDVFAIAIDDV